MWRILKYDTAPQATLFENADRSVVSTTPLVYILLAVGNKQGGNAYFQLLLLSCSGGPETGPLPPRVRCQIASPRLALAHARAIGRSCGRGFHKALLGVDCKIKG